jgi:integrase
VSYRVLWREDGKRVAEKFSRDNLKEAERFQRAVTRAGDRYPDDWIAGLGYLDDLRPEVEVRADAAAKPTAPTLLKVALEHFADGPNRHSKSAPEHRLKVRRDMQRLLPIGGLGATPINEVTNDDIQEWLDALAEELAFKTVKGHRANLGAVFRIWCREHGGANPVEGSFNGGVVTSFKPVFLKTAEVDAIVDQLPTEQDKVYVELLVGTGMRKGEALALQIWDLDLDANEIDINKARKHSPQGAKHHRIGDPKTDSSRRIIGIDDGLAARLREFTRGRAGSELVFDLGNEGTWQNNHWAPARARAGLRKNPRIHDLRHTHASILLSKGARLFAVSRRLGHKDIQTTANIYGHLDRSEDAGLAAVYGAARGR